MSGRATEEIRPARREDVEPVHALLRECRLVVDGVSQELDVLLVATIDGELAGVAACERHGADGLLRSVAVAPAARGRGLAGSLCTAVESRAAALGVRDLYLLTETAERFFARRGYQRIDRALAPPGIARSREFSALCPASAVLMLRRR